MLQNDVTEDDGSIIDVHMKVDNIDSTDDGISYDCKVAINLDGRDSDAFDVMLLSRIGSGEFVEKETKAIRDNKVGGSNVSVLFSDVEHDYDEGVDPFGHGVGRTDWISVKVIVQEVDTERTGISVTSGNLVVGMGSQMETHRKA